LDGHRIVWFYTGRTPSRLLPYFRTAFRAGGWKNIKRSAWIAFGALALFVIERIIQNQEIDSIKKFVGRIFR